MSDDGALNEERARQLVRRIGEDRHRSRAALLVQLRRLIQWNIARRSARVQSAVPLQTETRKTLSDRLERLYGHGLRTSFEETPALIGGMRIKVYCDVYDGSVKGALDRLEARL
jgi:F0F1-type ATP synthase delta subunit